MFYFTGFGLETFLFIIILTRYFTGTGLFGLQILITITIFHGIWTLKYLDYSLDFDCYLPYWIKT